MLDLRQGLAVTGQGGDRAHYRPVESRLQPGSADPRRLAAAYRDQLGLTELYLADLDAIAGAPPQLALFRQLIADGFSLVVDAGLPDAQAAQALAGSGVPTIVAGLETLAGPEVLRELVESLGPERVLFSLDLKGGMPLLAPGHGWPATEPLALVRLAIEQGVRQILRLDLGRVGTSKGAGAEEFLSLVRGLWPAVAWSVGGGVAGLDDLIRLRAVGAARVLVATALHDGRIGRAELRALAGPIDGSR